MNQFYLDIEASSSYGTTAPTLEILVDGAVVGSASINSSGTFSFLLDYPSMDTFPSALSLRFNDGSGEAGRTITIANVRVNGQLVASSSISQSVLNQNDSSTLNTSAEDHLFGRVDPSSPDLGTVTISGTGGADNLQATNGDDVIDGAAGNDRIRGVYGDDAINGGAGDDTIFGEDGNDIILGGTGADLIFGNNGNDLLFGQDDNDRLMGGNGNDTLNGGAGNDLLMGGNDDDILYGEAGVDRLIGQNGDDVLYGDAGNDTLSGGNGNDTLYGGSGDDYLIGGTGADTLNGGDDDDFILGNTGADILNGDAGNDYIYGGDDNDTLNGGADNDALHGDAGNDTLNGDAGNDTLIGGFGADTLNGGTGNDILHGHGLDAMAVSAILNANANVVYSEDTNSFYQLVSTSVTLAGAQGVSGASSLNGVAGHLVTVTSQTENDFVDTLADGNQVWLNGSDSVVEGEWRWAGGDEDNLMFWNGNNAGALENGFYGNWNAGVPNGTAGEDGMVMTASGAWDGLSVTSTNFYVIEWDGADFSDDNAIDTLSGDDGNDYLNGHGGNDILSGGNGVDHIVGGAGNDTLNGNSDNDYLYDSLGNNTFNGGTGDDILDARFQTAIPSIADQIATILSENPAVSYSVDTGNFYEMVNTSLLWDAAVAASEANLVSGVGGHLITITSQAENDFVEALHLGSDIWLGASDRDNEGEWIWMVGPEAGTQFWTGTSGGTASGYENWTAGEPNDYQTGEDYATMWQGGGNWNDNGGPHFPTRTFRYVVEWESSEFLITPPTTPVQGINTMNGGDGDDIIYGGAEDDIINGNNDDDIIYGNEGDDTIDGGSGTDEIYGGVGSDTINGGSGNDTLYAAYVPGVSAIPLNVTFDTGTDGFSYTDGGFGGSDPGSVSVTGARITTDGNTTNGALQVNINMTNNSSVTNASGSWDITINLASALDNAELSFAYRLFNDGQTDGGENTFAYVEVDGTQYGTSGNDWVDSLNGANGNSDQNTGWVTVSLSLGALSSGSHTISIGALINSANRSDEDSWIRIDDVVLSNPGATTDDSAYTNIINGGDGNDVIYGSNGTDTLNGGDGNDTIRSASTAGSGNLADILADNTGLFYDSGTGNLYQYVGSSTTWTNANAAAQASTLIGGGATTGHLATITSASEQSFVWGLTGSNNIWGDGTDSGTEGNWQWQSGPEDNTQFWSGGPTGSAVGGQYNNWIPGSEPWDSGASYDYFILRAANGGQWYTEQIGGNHGYVIEWEGSSIITTVGGSTSILNGGDGLDDLYGGAGSDHFVFENASAFDDVDLINNFDVTDNDALDISDILSSAGYNSATDAITDYLQITNNGLNSDVRVDVTGNANFGANTQIADIIGVTGLTDETALVNNGVIIV